MILSESLPLYQVRKYIKTERVNSLLYIYTYYDRYILDDTSIEGDFNTRRAYILLHSERYDAKLYPLSHRCNTLAQVSESIKKSKFFVDRSGRLIEYKPRVFYKITTYRVVNIVMIGHQKFLLTIKVDAFSHINLVSSEAGNYAQVIRIGNAGFILYGVSSEDQPEFRRKL